MYSKGEKNEIELKHLAFRMFIIIIPVIRNWKGKMRGIKIKREEIKLSLFAGNMFSYVDNPRDQEGSYYI